MNAIAQASAAPVTGPKLDNRRVLAAVVDLAIVVAGSVVILFAAEALSGERGDVRGALGMVMLGWALYYYFALESGDGQTVGKKLMKLRVVRADGRPAGMREIAVRTVLRVVDGVGAYIVGLIVMLATGQRRQRLGDLAAGTIVVDASAAAHVPPAPVASQPVEEEPVVEEAEPVEVVVEDEVVEPDPVVEDEPVAEASLPEVSTPSLEELAHDVAAARAEDASDVDAPEKDESDADEPMTFRSVETVSAIDLVMGGASEDEPSSEQRDQDPEDPAAS
jgi:uncharacterized RDD family membrane protein YckC